MRSEDNISASVDSLCSKIFKLSKKKMMGSAFIAFAVLFVGVTLSLPLKVSDCDLVINK